MEYLHLLHSAHFPVYMGGSRIFRLARISFEKKLNCLGVQIMVNSTDKNQLQTQLTSRVMVLPVRVFTKICMLTA